MPVCGTIDFFPNGGNLQPGCKRIDLLDITSVTELGKFSVQSC